MRGGPNELKTRLRATIAKLRGTVEHKNRELHQLRGDIPALVRVINQLNVENEQLRALANDSSDTVIQLPRRNTR